MERTCTQCKTTKDITEFYKHKKCRGGYKPSCKACHRVYYKNYRINNPEKIIAFNKATRARRAPINRDPIKRQAQNIIRSEVRAGRMVALDKCEACDTKTKTEAHHNNYNKPLEIVWLCKPCHMKYHRLIDGGELIKSRVDNLFKEMTL